MQTRRDYLVGLGLAKAGRGKFSTVAKEALDKARGEGIKFSDDDAPVKVAKKDIGEKPAPVSKPGETPWLSPDDYRFPEKEYRAVAVIGGKRTIFGMREACNVCRYSLTNHICDTPSVLGHAVIIERAA